MKPRQRTAHEDSINDLENRTALARYAVTRMQEDVSDPPWDVADQAATQLTEALERFLQDVKA